MFFFIFGRFSIAGKLPKWPKIPFQYPLALRHPKILEKCRKHHRILVSVRNRFWPPPAKADIATAILTNVIEHLVLLLPPNKHAFTAKAVWADFRISALCHTAYTLRQVWPTGASCVSLQRGSNLSLQSLVQKSSCWVNHRPRWPRKSPLKARSRHLWWSKATRMLLILGRTCLVKFGQEQQQAGHICRIWSLQATGASSTWMQWSASMLLNFLVLQWHVQTSVKPQWVVQDPLCL